MKRQKFVNFLLFLTLSVFIHGQCAAQGVPTGVFLFPQKAVYEQTKGPLITAQLNHLSYPNGATIQIFVMRKRPLLEPVIEHGPFTSAAGSWHHTWIDSSGMFGVKYFAIAFRKEIVNGSEIWIEFGRSEDYEFAPLVPPGGGEEE